MASHVDWLSDWILGHAWRVLYRVGFDLADVIIFRAGQVDKRVLAMYFFWNARSQDRSGIQLVRFLVQRLGLQVFPALL